MNPRAMADPALNDALCEFYDKAARRRLTWYYSIIVSASMNVLELVKSSDRRFGGGEIRTVGSSASDTSAILLEEADILLSVLIDGRLEVTEHPEYVRFKPSSSSREEWKDCVDEDGYLQPRKFSNLFYSLVETNLETVKEEANSPLLKLKGKDTIAATIVYDLLSFKLDVSVDLVAALQCKVQVPWNEPAWLQGSIPGCWPRESTVNTIRERGVELVSKDFEGEYYFRLSFSATETDLLNDAVDMLPSFKKQLVTLKTLRKLYFAPTAKHTTPALKSYHLKILLIHEAIAFPKPEFWPEEQLEVRFISILKRLTTSIENQFLPHLFLPDVSLFNYGVPVFLRRHELLSDPLQFMQKAVADYKPGDHVPQNFFST